jgi:hypothetical protein
MNTPKIFILLSVLVLSGCMSNAAPDQVAASPMTVVISTSTPSPVPTAIPTPISTPTPEPETCTLDPQTELFRDASAGLTVPVLSNQDAREILGEEVSFEGILSQVAFDIAQLQKSNLTSISNVIIPEYINLSDVRNHLEGNGITQTEFEIKNYDPSTGIKNEDTLLVSVHAGKESWTMALWRNPSLSQRPDGSNVIDGELMLIVETDNDGNSELRPVPAQRIGTSRADIAIVDGCPPNIIRVTPDGKVQAILAQNPDLLDPDNLWVENEEAIVGIPTNILPENLRELTNKLEEKEIDVLWKEEGGQIVMYVLQQKADNLEWIKVATKDQKNDENLSIITVDNEPHSFHPDEIDVDEENNIVLTDPGGRYTNSTFTPRAYFIDGKWTTPAGVYLPAGPQAHLFIYERGGGYGDTALGPDGLGLPTAMSNLTRDLLGQEVVFAVVILLDKDTVGIYRPDGYFQHLDINIVEVKGNSGNISFCQFKKDNSGMTCTVATVDQGWKALEEWADSSVKAKFLQVEIDLTDDPIAYQIRDSLLGKTNKDGFPIPFPDIPEGYKIDLRGIREADYK